MSNVVCIKNTDQRYECDDVRAELADLQDRFNTIQAELAKHRWIPVGEMPEGLDRRIELLTHKGWVDCGYKDAYGKGFNLGTGEVYMPASHYTHYRFVILPEGE